MSEIDAYRVQQIVDSGNAVQISLIEDVQTEPLSQKQLITENVAKKLLNHKPHLQPKTHLHLDICLMCCICIIKYLQKLL